MRSKVFALPGLSPVRFAINYAELDGQSALNHHETHIHKEYEIYLNLSGNVSFEVQSRLYPVSRGSVVLSKPYEYHRCVYHSDTLHRHYWIIFSADGIEALFPSQSEELRRVEVNVFFPGTSMYQHLNFNQLSDPIQREPLNARPS